MKATKKPLKHDDANDTSTNDTKLPIIAWDGTPPPPDEPPKG